MTLRAAAALPNLLAALAFAALLTWLAAWRPFSPLRITTPTALELAVVSEGEGNATLSYDEGHGYSTDRPTEVSVPFPRAEQPTLRAVPLHPGRVREVRCDVEHVTQLRILSAMLRMGQDRREPLPLSQLRPGAGAQATLDGSGLTLQPAVLGEPITFFLAFSPPLIVPAGTEPSPLEAAATFALFFLAAWAGLVCTEALWPACQRAARKVVSAARQRPRTTLALVALLSTMASTSPVLFGGKSFVSPNSVAYLLHLGSPTIAGAPREGLAYGAGTDLGATMWQTLPYSVVESRALWKDHEFPLWNRYNSAGVSLWGQGLSMLGDPLHALPLLTGGAWWAWDLKFVFAKVLFCLGTGLCSWSLTRRLGASALVAASAAWIGFFAYRFNHPAFFSVCYAPWSLLPWLVARNSPKERRWLCALALFAGDWMELVSGTAKEAALLLICLNGTGVLMLLLGSGPASARWRRLAPMLWATAIFLLISAPVWLVFLDALRQAVTVYDVPHAYQLQPGFLIAFFDSIFSQDFARQENITHPSLNFLILFGLLWGFWERRPMASDRASSALAASAGMAAAMVFGVVPPALIVGIPFLARIEHIYNVFGCVLLVLLLPLSALGWARCLEPAEGAFRRGTLLRVLASLGALLLLYFGFVQAVPESPLASYHSEVPLHSRFFAAYVPALLLAFSGLAPGLTWLRTRPAGVLLAAVCLFVLHFRGGMFGPNRLEDYVMTPRSGWALHTRSPAVEEARRAAGDAPGRVMGFSATLSPGYNALLGLEGIAGPDALHNPWYVDLAAATGLNCAWGWRLTVEEDSLAKLKPVYDLLNLRFYLREIEGPAPALPGLRFRSRTDFDLYESAAVWPRAFFCDHWVECGPPAAFAQLLAHGDGRPFAGVAAPLARSPVSFGAREIVPATAYRLTNNTTEFQIDAPRAGVAALTECYEEGNFRVTINGRPADYFRFNGAFKGVFLPAAGQYRIRFSYWPRLLTPALWLAALGMVFAGLTLVRALWPFWPVRIAFLSGRPWRLPSPAPARELTLAP